MGEIMRKHVRVIPDVRCIEKNGITHLLSFLVASMLKKRFKQVNSAYRYKVYNSFRNPLAVFFSLGSHNARER